MDSVITKIKNGKFILPGGLRKDLILYIKDGKIDSISEINEDIAGAIEIDANGRYVSPGFIDIHVHGGGGYDFMDNDAEGFLEIAKMHAMHGTTAMNPTTLSSNKTDLLETIRIYDEVKTKNRLGAEFIGIHIEGPYFSMAQRGAQDPRHIHHPDANEYNEILAQTKSITRWSAAPELPGAIEFGRVLTQKNILPAIAHTDAIYEDVIQALEAGYTHSTHFYSCMSSVKRKNALRYAGVIESIFLLDEITTEIIADGVHLPAPLLKLVYKIKGPAHTALITDAMRAAGMGDGPSILGSKHDGTPVIIENGVAKLPDRSAFAGSVATADQLVRNAIKSGDIPLLDAVQMASSTPAKIMKIEERKGSLQKGKDADIVIFDNDINIYNTLVRGNLIYEKAAVTERAVL